MKEKELKIKDIEKILVSIKQTVDNLPTRYEMNKRFEQVDKRFEQVDKRFEQVDKRFALMHQEMDRRFKEVTAGNDKLIGSFIKIEQESAAHSLTYQNHEKRITKLELQLTI
ncbi:hypothetical protein COZ84_03460 [Candidatus Kuenenbacteria bacterium CG_4_8_14_3_um_filter_39_15]|uniref:t-SNARE coiled-coil homology domain-containing protein n=5 Tax=Candidatus Kueneniibacteriota TaxID=1752740 RepID=A0A2M7IKY2_9BACT|nr:MAG: hypothetical protein AUK13_02185 [Candidatus Kuenenbacteria bacterium CG2_30_39_24]PIP75220.1 MAG: hypothetical protein COW86_05005 [Candidatus Kuenenbacteria bacterium CG22_combo_CG10-13_8_21_14_all_39_9]PIR80723.1 MAG: hypothetical protein COU24_02460 [Candidatus Kuenenbacteria bacterium CG10_big_fil_rev_8_21_14_0_10_39_14]PIW95461.1 MAG: hypothetical protein COZ84_03460 [Candidatus Kuenenbacteria bacterium CG_4_8_14_3_um_filter_39_15]PIX92113.1 MAG: hypothetical protein COZ26_03520 [